MHAPLNLPAPPWIIGHRGAAGEAPENSLESFQLAVQQGADMIELDLQITADGRILAFHDWDFMRLADEPHILEQSTLAELRQLEGAGEERIPTLAAVLNQIPPTMPLNLELKRRSASISNFIEVLAEAIQDRPELLVSSFDWQLLAAVRQAMPELPVGPLGSRDSEALVAMGEELDAYALHCHLRLARSGFLAAAESSSRPVLVYTVNDADVAGHLFQQGVAGVFTDFPGRLRRQLEQLEINT